MIYRTLAISAIALAASFGSANWSTFHGNNQRTGRASVAGPAQPRTIWTCNLNGPMISSPVLANDGTIYVMNQAETLVPKNYLNAVNPNGTIKWRYELPWIDDMSMATPAVGPDGRIYGGTATGLFYCVSPAGQLVWSIQANKAVNNHTLVTADGSIYTVLDEKFTSIRPDGTIRWQYALDADYVGGPTEGLDGTLYIFGYGGLRAHTPAGTLKWTAFANFTMAPPAIAPNGDIIAFGSACQAIDPADGSVRWANYINGDGTYGTPAIDAAGNVYHGSGYKLFKITSTGATAMTGYLESPGSNLLGNTWSSAITDSTGRVYLGLGTGKRSAIAFEKNLMVLNSNMVRTYLTPLAEIAGTAVPALGDDGRLYVGCLDGKLYCLGN